MAFINWIPKYIREIIARLPRHVVTATEYNELFNKLIEQGDHNAEAIADIRNTITDGDLIMGEGTSVNWGAIYGIPDQWPGSLSWTDILEAINTTYIDANGVWTPKVYAQNISTLYAKILTAQIEHLKVGVNVEMDPDANINWGAIVDKPTDFGLTEEEIIELYNNTDLAFKWADDVLALITTTYIDANGVWTPYVYTNHIVAGTALIQDALIQSLDADKITGDIGRFGTTVINNLTADKATIAELTVDRLDTSDKVQRRLANDTTTLGYMQLYNQNYDFVQAVYAGDIAGLPNEEQAVNRFEEPLYWIDVEHTGTTLNATDWPVMVYVYDELVKLKFYHDIDPETGYANPMMIFGAGDLNGRSKGYMYKDADELVLSFENSVGEMREIRMGEDGIIITPYELQAITFSATGFAATYSGTTYDWTWTKDGTGKITELQHDGNTIPVTWA